MHAWNDFLSTDYGLMSAAVIVFMLIMMVYIGFYVAKHVKESAMKHDAEVQKGIRQS
ncbi:DUF3149 domain-containing protein [Aquabacterium sp.]|uniref:DUF3149 domain-containing protein n=1 Tax=Aquabacterium sp. TaxID=1872578 RepID=UPI0035B2164A